MSRSKSDRKKKTAHLDKEDAANRRTISKKRRAVRKAIVRRIGTETEPEDDRAQLPREPGTQGWNTW